MNENFDNLDNIAGNVQINPVMGKAILDSDEANKKIKEIQDEIKKELGITDIEEIGFIGAENQPVPNKPVLSLDESLFVEARKADDKNSEDYFEFRQMCVSKIFDALRKIARGYAMTEDELETFTEEAVYHLLDSGDLEESLKEEYEQKYIDKQGNAFGEPGAVYTYSEIKNMWDRDKDSDYVMKDYTSFEDWWNDTVVMLDEVDDDLEESCPRQR